MSERSVHLCVTRETLRPVDLWVVRWITEKDQKTFAEPFQRGQDHGWALEEFQHLRDLGYMYCGIFLKERLCSVCGVWKRADDVWEVIAVGTKEEFRKRGMACSTVYFAADHILQHVKVASYTSRASNTASIRTAQSVGFEFCRNVVNNEKWCASNPRPPLEEPNCPLMIS